MFSLLRGRRRPPPGLRPPLERDERVTAWAATSTGGAVVATNRGLWLPDRGRLGWHEIHKAAWSGRQLTVTPAAMVAERDGYAVMADEPAVPVLLPEPGRLPDEVRARVTRSVSHTVHHPLGDDGAGVRVVGRRVSGVDGISWAVRYDPGVDPDGPDVAARTGHLVEQARMQTQVTE